MQPLAVKSSARLLAVLSILLLLTACQPQPAAAPTLPAASPSAAPALPSAPSAAPEQPASEPTADSAPPEDSPAPVSPASVPSAPANPGETLPPEDWKNWPVVPQVSDRAREIYQQGLQRGTNPQAFSVVGDCQSIPGVFMGVFGNSLGYSLKPDEQYLQETIDHFSGSFDRDGIAVRGGFTAASLLSPLQADPSACKPGESPLSCEFRVHNPSIVIISLETWRTPATIDRYEVYLRQIIEASIQQGVLPILATKADMAETGKEHVINPAVARLASEYQLPMMNFWRAVQGIEHKGIDPARDTFHLTREAWLVKSFTGLRALDAVWRAVNAQTAPAASETVLNTAPTPQPTAEPLQFTPPDCPAGDNCVLLDLTESRDGSLHDRGVFLFNLNSQALTPLTAEDVRLQDVLPDGQSALLSRGTELYQVRLADTTPTLITDAFTDHGSLSAYYLSDGQSILLLSDREGYPALWKTSAAAADWQRLTGESDSPIALVKSPQAGWVYWQAGACSSRIVCQASGYQRTSMDGQTQPVGDVQQLTISNDAQSLAFMDPQTAGDYGFIDKLVIENAETRLPSRRLIVFPPANGYKVRNRLNQFLWSPSDSHMLILVDEFSKYYEQSSGYHLFIFWVKQGWYTEFPRLTGMMPGAVWSPDGQELFLWVSKAQAEGQYSLSFERFNPFKQERTVLDQNPALTGLPYTYVNRAFWLPPTP